MSKYLLPCDCGKGIAIDASQAGQQITCECGKLLEVPTLRDVRALEPIPDTAASAQPAAEWNSSRGMIFAGSLLLFVSGAAVAYFGYEGLRHTPNITREIERESFDKAIDDMSLNETYETWELIREHGLGTRGRDPLVNIRSFRAGRQRMVMIGIALCAVGLVGAIGSVLGQRKSTV